MSRRYCRSCVWSVLAVVLAGAPAHAQMQPGQPGQAGPPGQAGQPGQPMQPGRPQAPLGSGGGQQRAWFGNDVGRVGQALFGQITLGGGTIDRRFTDPVTFDQTTRRSDNWHAAGGLTYTLSGASASLAVSAASNVNSFSRLSDQLVVSHRGQISASLQPTARTSVFASAAAFREPTLVRYLRGLFGPTQGPALPDDIDVGDVEDATVSYMATTGLSQQLSTRSALNFRYAHRRSTYSGLDQVQIHDSASARYNLALAKSLSVHLGYAYLTSHADTPGAVRSEGHHLDVGINYNYGKALSLSPNTTLSFNTGTALARSRSHTRFVVTGNVDLTHRMGRSWSAGAHYNRSVRFLEGVTEIAVVDAISGNIGGSLSRRVVVDAGVSTRRGRVGLGVGSNPFRGIHANAGMSIAASRNVGVAIRYGYFRSRFNQTTFLLSPALQRFERHSVGVSVGFWGLVGVGVNYSNSQRPFGRDQAVLASMSFFAPIYARVRRF